MTPLVLVLVGTDHHPFDRLVQWADEIALLRPDLRLLVQHGATRGPRYAEGRDYLPHDELRELVDEASAVVCHGGPGTIMDARDGGHVPLCVPRDPALGEHVDAHQMRFAALVARTGVVVAIDRADQLHAAIHACVFGEARRSGRQAVPANPAVDAARLRLAEELDRLALVDG